MTTEILDVVFESVDHLEEMVYDIADGGDGKRDVQSTVEKLKRIEAGEPAELETTASAEEAATMTKEAPEQNTNAIDELKLSYDDFENGYFTIF